MVIAISSEHLCSDDTETTLRQQCAININAAQLAGTTIALSVDNPSASTLSPATPAAYVGDTVQFTATGTMTDGTSASVTLTVNNGGSLTITATAPDCGCPALIPQR